MLIFHPSDKIVFPILRLSDIDRSQFLALDIWDPKLKASSKQGEQVETTPHSKDPHQVPPAGQPCAYSKDVAAKVHGLRLEPPASFCWTICLEKSPGLADVADCWDVGA